MKNYLFIKIVLLKVKNKNIIVLKQKYYLFFSIAIVWFYGKIIIPLKMYRIYKVIVWTI